MLFTLIAKWSGSRISLARFQPDTQAINEYWFGALLGCDLYTRLPAIGTAARHELLT